MGRPKQFDPSSAVAAATDLFWRQGYGGTTPADLTGELGIGKGSLYHAFASKHALFERALRRYGDERVARLLEVLDRPGPVRARIQAALERLASPENAELRQRGCLAVNTASELGPDDSAIAIVRGVFDRMERAFQAAIEVGQASGELDQELDARATASLLLAVILGMTVIARAGDRGGRLKRIVRAAMAVL
jgi:TetR/AcrR family transcriptional regulator, transcriptional repressor for nem operon